MYKALGCKYGRLQLVRYIGNELTTKGFKLAQLVDLFLLELGKRVDVLVNGFEGIERGGTLPVYFGQLFL